MDFHFIATKAPARLALPRPQSERPSTTTAFDGSWRATPGSVAGYRVQEDFLFQQMTMAGRTNDVSGSMVIADGTATRASFTVSVAGVATSKSERNVMDVTKYPAATFVLTRPIALGTAPAANGRTNYRSAVGTFTVHGVTRMVTAQLSAEHFGNSIYVLADIPFDSAAWDISIEGAGAFGGIKSSWTLEALLHLTRGS